MTDNEIAEKEFFNIDKWDFESEIEALTKILELNITDLKLLRNIYRRRASSYRALELYENAIEDYSIVFDLQLKLNESPYYNIRADCFKNIGQYLKAIEDYSNSKYIVYEGRAYCYEQIGELDKAILDYKQGITKYTKEIEEYGDDDDVVGMSYMSRGDCYKGLKEWEKAIVDYECGTNSSVGNEEICSDGYSKAGDCYMALQDYDSALFSYTHVIQCLRNEPSIIVRQQKDIFNKRSVVNKALGLYEEAKKDKIYANKLQELLKTCKSKDKIMLEILENSNSKVINKSTKGRKLDLHNMSAEECFEQGWEQANNNNFEEALKLYNKAISLDNEYEMAYAFRSIANSAMHDYKSAIEDCNTALKLIKRNEDTPPQHIVSILVSRADIYVKQDLYDEAINDCREALKLLNNNEDLESVAFVKAQLANAFALRHRKFSKINDLVIAYFLDNSSIGIEADKILQEKLKNVPIELFENMPVEELIETVNSCCNTLDIEGQVAKSIHTKPTKGRKLDL